MNNPTGLAKAPVGICNMGGDCRHVLFAENVRHAVTCFAALAAGDGVLGSARKPEEEKRIEVKSYFAVTVASSPNCTSFPAPLNLYET